MSNTETTSLFDEDGNRKYLNEAERKTFYSSCNLTGEYKALYILMIFWTGARPSEVLNLSIRHIDFSEKMVIIRSLKKRSKVVYRQIPLPDVYLNRLHSFLKSRINQKDESIWDFSYRSACRYIKTVMLTSNIIGAKSCARGLRHSFAVKAVLKNVPLTTVQKWMGHASIKTTAIYLNIIGLEERKFAERMWDYN